MTYQITLTNGTVLATVADNELDTTTSLALVGKDYLGYGTALNDDLVRLLENFANGTAPSNPLVGQLWYDSTNHAMKNWNGSAWISLTGAVQSVVGEIGDVTLDKLVSGGVAPISSPDFHGTPTAPTASSGDSSFQLANTSFVSAAVTPLSTQLTNAISGVDLTPDMTHNGGQLAQALRRYGSSNIIRDVRVLSGGSVSLTPDNCGVYEINAASTVTFSLPALPTPPPNHLLRYRIVNIGTSVVQVQPVGSDVFYPSATMVKVPAGESVDFISGYNHWLWNIIEPNPSSYLSVSATGITLLTLDMVGTITVDATAGNITLSLPPVDSASDEAIYYHIVRLDSSSNTVTLTANSGNPIRPGSSTSFTLGPLGVVDLISNGGSQWNALQSIQSLNFTNVTGALGFIPVQQAGTSGQSNNKVYIGWNGTGLKSKVDFTDLGYLLTSSSTGSQWTIPSSGAQGGTLVLSGFGGAPAVADNYLNQFRVYNPSNATHILSYNVTSGQLITGGPIDSTGTITANSGRLRASIGARGSGDPAAATLLSDFAQAWTGLNQGWVIRPDQFAIQATTGNANAGGGIVATTFTLPATFSGGIFAAMCCFGGDAPPGNPGSIACTPVSANSVQVTTNYPGPPGILGVVIWALGFGPLV